MRNIHEFEIKNMLRMANDARDRAYSPYSKFSVGACLKAASGAYYLGCNIENASYSATCCAERVAIFKAVYEGERSFDAIAIVCDGADPAIPCGSCLQVLAEFCDAEMPVICANCRGEYKAMALGDLLQYPFVASELKK